jgi:transcription initiation factor IIF auxiliary subunit
MFHPVTIAIVIIPQWREGWGEKTLNINILHFSEWTHKQSALFLLSLHPRQIDERVRIFSDYKLLLRKEMSRATKKNKSRLTNISD